MTEPPVVPCQISPSLHHVGRCTCAELSFSEILGKAELEEVEHTLEIQNADCPSDVQWGHAPSCDPGDCGGCGG